MPIPVHQEWFSMPTSPLLRPTPPTPSTPAAMMRLGVTA